MSKKNLDLYSDNHPETTLKNTGYKDKEKALATIKLINKRSLKYQFDVINTMLNRAKYHKNKTEDMDSAIKIFKEWIKNYKIDKKLQDEKYEWINYKDLLNYEKLAELYNIKIDFIEKIKEINGKYYKLQYMLLDNDKPDGQDYWSYRINFIDKQVKKFKKNKTKLYYEIGKYKGLPTKEHLQLILHGYIIKN